MALSPVKPFCYSTYLHSVENFPDWMVSYVQKTTMHNRTGWLGHFCGYKYSRRVSQSNQPVWLEGVVGRARFTQQLTSSLHSDATLMKVVNEIMEWGGMGTYPGKFAPGIRKALNALQSGGGNSAWDSHQTDDLDTGGTIASMSKVFAMFNPQEWAIYDSRVASALSSLVRHFRNATGAEVNDSLLRFPVPQRRKGGWQRPTGFPTVSGGRQGCIAFIYASWLQRRVAEILRTNSKVYGCPPTAAHAASIAPLNANWQVYHVEMALWMMGDKQF